MWATIQTICFRYLWAQQFNLFGINLCKNIHQQSFQFLYHIIFHLNQILNIFSWIDNPFLIHRSLQEVFPWHILKPIFKDFLQSILAMFSFISNQNFIQTWGTNLLNSSLNIIDKLIINLILDHTTIMFTASLLLLSTTFLFFNFFLRPELIKA